MIFLQQSIQTVAYETARFAAASQSTSAVALDRGNQVLADRNVNGGRVEVEPNDLSSAIRGSNIVVNVTVPLDDNRIMPRFFFGGQQLRSQVTMMKE